MSEQSGRNESSERPGAGRSGSDRSGSDRSGSQRSGSQRSSSDRQRQAGPASDMLSDFQRWLLRNSAKSMGRELSGQVRRTLGGDRRQASTADVWDTATTEIPPEVGESPECQWCPICRAARRMREGGPGIGGQLSGAGDAVASVVQDAISAVDSILSRGGGIDQPAPGSSRPGSAARSGSASATAGRSRGATTSGPEGSGRAHEEGAARDATASGARADGRAAGASAEKPAVPGQDGADKPPSDKLATDRAIDPDPWAGATEAHDGMGDAAQPGTGAGAGASPTEPDEAQLDGQGHEPDDRS